MFACYECGSKYAEKQDFCTSCLEFKTIIPVPEEGKVFFQRRERRLISSKELANLPLHGRSIKGFECFGRLPDSWLILLWGLPGTGKTTLSLRFAAATKERVLYCSIEQGQGESIIKTLIDWEIRQDDLVISDARNTREVRQDLIEYNPDILILDSITALGATLLHKKTVWIAQATKSGEYRGSMEFAHDADIVCCLKDKGEVEIVKNRFGDTGLFKI